MKIIKPGKLASTDTFTTSCRNCKCVFEFQRSEAKAHWNLYEYALRIACPTCGLECFAFPSMQNWPMDSK
jgi:hypothetical protein